MAISPSYAPLIGRRFSLAGKVYLAEDQGMRWINDPETYNSLFRDWNSIEALDGSAANPEVVQAFNQAPTGPILGGTTLAKDPNAPEVYLIDFGQKRHIHSPAVMDQYDFSWEAIQLLSAVPFGTAISGTVYPHLDQVQTLRSGAAIWNQWRAAQTSAIELGGAVLFGYDLTGANLTGVRLDGANLTAANLAGVNLSGSSLMRVVGIETNLSGANLTGVPLVGANLSGANLAGANLSTTLLLHANLSGANLARANLSGADLTAANLEGANLSGVDLTTANLQGANLSYANLSGATLNLDLVMHEANLRGADLTDIHRSA